MPPPPPPKPQPRPDPTRSGGPIPEFMWCQRSDRVYVTIKVADCQETRVDVTSDHRLEFRGRGNGMCGMREYALEIQLAKPVIKAECRWFVCGPSVRVRLEKMERGPYWAGLLPKGAKMAQCKVDWQSWLDEDEESEVSAAPNGFDVDELQMKMLNEEDEFYKDPDHLSTSESEGEEENSVMLDDGMNDIPSIQAKFLKFDEEKKVRDRTKAERRAQREKTRAAQQFAAQHERDVHFGRPTRELTEEEQALVAGAETLRARLKKERAAEKAYFQAQWWHQRRPDAKHTAALTAVMRDAAVAEAQRAQERLSLADRAGRSAAKLAAYHAACRAAVDIVGREEKHQLSVREMARAAARDAVGRAVGAISDDAEPEWPPLNTPGWGDAALKAAEQEPAAPPSAEAPGDAEVRGATEAADELSLEANGEADDEDGPALETNGVEGSGDELMLEENAGEQAGAQPPPGVLV